MLYRTQVIIWIIIQITCVNESGSSTMIKLQRVELVKVNEFKYLGSTIQTNGQSIKGVKKRVQAEWNGWRQVICNRRIAA